MVIKIFFEAVDFFDSSNIPQFNFIIITSVEVLYNYYIVYFKFCQVKILLEMPFRDALYITNFNP